MNALFLVYLIAEVIFGIGFLLSRSINDGSHGRDS